MATRKLPMIFSDEAWTEVEQLAETCGILPRKFVARSLARGLAMMKMLSSSPDTHFLLEESDGTIKRVVFDF